MRFIVYLVADKWVYVPSVNKIAITRNAYYFFLRSYIAAFIFIINNINVWYYFNTFHYIQLF